MSSEAENGTCIPSRAEGIGAEVRYIPVCRCRFCGIISSELSLFGGELLIDKDAEKRMYP